MPMVCSEIYTPQLFERTLGVDLLGRNIAPLHLKTERLAETALRPGDFDKLRLEFPGLGGYFPVPGTLN